jgi:beta-galactosidase
MNGLKFGAMAALLCGFFACAAIAQTTQPQAQREKLLMDFGWRFALGNAHDADKDFGFGKTGFFNAKAGLFDGPAAAQFDDRGWRMLDLPHDWAVELPFDEHADGGHGDKPVGRGFPENNIGWYRKKFSVPASDLGRRIRIEFDGVFRDSTVFINGFRFGPHESGYTSFGYDISEVLNYGRDNVVAVRVDASQKEGWFYEGAGIYRHVWLSKTAPLHVATNGTFVTAEVKENSADVTARATICNEDKTETPFDIEQTIVDADGKSIADVAQKNLSVKSSERQEFSTNISVVNPKLWSLETRALYKLITTIRQGDAIVDRYETTFGIRTLRFDKNEGFFLNGKHVIVQGTCNHQDHAGVGAALPDSLQEFRIKQLQAMGCNAYRTSHNPPTPELLDACDRLGMLVLDETRQEGSDPQAQEQLQDMMMRDRNHPCIFLWSLGNEEFGMEGNTYGMRVTAVMESLAHRLDPSRLTTAAIDNGWETMGSARSVDVMGFNYFNHGDTDHYHAKNPDQPTIGSEEASTYSTRGIYFDDLPNAHLSAYDVHDPSYGSTAHRWTNFYAPRHYIAGAFVWTGFDYRGEPSPFGWPAISSQFGILDTCGFPKDNFYYYQSCWTQTPMVHLLPHWNWRGKEGQEVEVWCFSNCDEVELLLNDQSIGREAMKPLSHVQWKVKYQPGVLLARGYKNGKQVVEDRIETTGAAAAIQLQPDRQMIQADGEDASLVTVRVVDSQGRAVPDANNEIQFAIDGPGKIIGVGNGDPSSHEPDKFVDVVQSFSIGDWRMMKVDSTENRPETAENFDDSSWTPAFARSNERPPRQQIATDAVYRGSVDVPQIGASSSVSMQLRRMGDEQWVYLNGKQIAHMSGDDARSPVDLKSDEFHVGKNLIAVVATPRGGGRDAFSRDQNSIPAVRVFTPAGSWKRSLFEGLAQVIVQANRSEGEITLTATAKGLTPMRLKMQSQPARSRRLVLGD